MNCSKQNESFLSSNLNILRALKNELLFYSTLVLDFRHSPKPAAEELLSNSNFHNYQVTIYPRQVQVSIKTSPVYFN